MPAVSFSFKMDTNICILNVSGSVDAHSAPELNKKIQEISVKSKRIILDFTKLDYISTAGLGVLIATFNEVKKDKGNIILSGMSEKIKKVFDTMGFSKVFKIVNNIEQAKKLF
jgi:anti-sigma B factor antagonist